MLSLLSGICLPVMFDSWLLDDSALAAHGCGVKQRPSFLHTAHKHLSPGLACRNSEITG